MELVTYFKERYKYNFKLRVKYSWLLTFSCIPWDKRRYCLFVWLT